MPPSHARPHVLMTTDAVGGVWTYATTLVTGLAARGVRCTLAVLGPPPDAAALEPLQALSGVTTHLYRCQLEWMPESGGDVERSARWLRDLAGRVEADVVHINGYAHAAWDFGRPTIVVAHSCVRSWWRAVHGEPAPAEWDRYRRQVETGLAAATCVVSPTNAMLGALRQEYAWSGPADVIRNGLPSPAPAHRPKHRQIFAAGRIWDEAKNMRALDDVASRLPWPVVMAGDACTPDGDWRIPRHADYVGRLSWPDVTCRMTESAIYALPARYEPFGLSALEAAQRGCALVLGDIASLRELWDGAAEFVPPDDRDALRVTIGTLCDDEPRRTRLAAAAQRRARRYSCESMVDRYLALYNALSHTAPKAVSCAS
jgi:glycogen synthase